MQIVSLNRNNTNFSLSCEGNHYGPVKKLLKYSPLQEKIRGNISFSFSEGFAGPAIEQLDPHERRFLETWTRHYQAAFEKVEKQVETHEELRDYKKVRNGALIGIGAGVAAGAGIDGISTATGRNGIGWEIAARALPALIEAAGIIAPFLRRIYNNLKYKVGLLKEKPEKSTKTEEWAFGQLLGPVIGTGMLIVGETTRLNNDPAYKALAVVTLNTGNNVLGALWTLRSFYKDAREITTSKTDYKTKRLYEKYRSIKDDVYLALCNFVMDNFQVSNAFVATSWYGGEQILRHYGIAAENISIGNSGFGGKTLAALESGLLSCDTPAAAWLAMKILKIKLRKEIRELTSETYLSNLRVSLS